MLWKFDGSGQWEAESSVDTYGSNPMWRVQVCDDGTFDVSATDEELLQYRKVKTFSTLKIAKSYCASGEAARVAVHISKVFKHISFIGLYRLADHWEIAHVSHDGVSIASVCGKTLSQVVSDYREVCKSIDINRQGLNHEHEWYKSIDGTTELCDCGAWR